MSPIVQLNIPPMEVQPIDGGLNRSAVATLSADRGMVKATVKAPNLLRITRLALEKSRLSSRWLASLFGCSEALISAQLSDHNEEKHLSMRKMGRIDDAGFWREFLMLLAEDLGFEILIVTPEQKQALRDVVVASANLQKVTAL